MRHMPYTHAISSRPVAASPLASARRRLADAVKALWAGYRERRVAGGVYRELARLDDDVLRDIGVPRHMISTIARRAGAKARATGFSDLRRGRWG